MQVHLQVVSGPGAGNTFTFSARDRFVIGRANGAHLQIADDPFFSRHHAMLEIDPPNVRLHDLKSTNGTYLNGIRLTEPTTLHHGDSISGGGSHLRIAIDDIDDVDATAATIAPPTARSIASLVTRSAREADPREKVAVRCMRCGEVAAHEAARARGEHMTYYCEPCQRALVEDPRLLAGYRTVRELGRGGMGAVFLAIDEARGEQRALKMILPRAAMSQRVREMFLREASSQGQLDHPNVVKMFELAEAAKGVFCMVMEFVDGKNAEQLLEARPAGLEPRFAATIVAQALDGLAHAHARGVVHRDIKDANLLVGYDARGQLQVKLSDFGLAKSYEMSGASGFTRTGDFAGTVFYMAPEQILDYRNVRPTADVYSMGVTLYRLLTNEWVYVRDTKDPLVTILEDPVVPVAVRRPDVPASIAAVVERATRKSPGDRFASAAEMRDALLASRE